MQDLESFSQAVYKTYNLSGFSLNNALALKSIEQDLLDEFNGINTEKAKSARAKRFKVGNPDDYSEKIFELDNQRKLIYGIRHEGLNPDLPFINCIPNFALESKEDAFAISSILQNELSVFKPKQFRFWSYEKTIADSIGATLSLIHI